MPISIDIHENDFLEEIWREGRDSGLRQGKDEGRQAAGPEQLQAWLLRVHRVTRIDDIFGE